MVFAQRGFNKFCNQLGKLVLPNITAKATLRAYNKNKNNNSLLLETKISLKSMD